LKKPSFKFLKKMESWNVSHLPGMIALFRGNNLSSSLRDSSACYCQGTPHRSSFCDAAPFPSLPFISMFLASCMWFLYLLRVQPLFLHFVVPLFAFILSLIVLMVPLF
jgi:hypothetical protein